MNAKTERVPHARLEHGDRCPGCRRGNVYEQKDPGVLVRVTGQAPLNATVYETEKLRCGACGKMPAQAISRRLSGSGPAPSAAEPTPQDRYVFERRRRESDVRRRQ